jgi:hypothetical protein
MSTNHLEELQRRLAVVRDRVLAVARRYANGFYLFGRAGTSKTCCRRTSCSRNCRLLPRPNWSEERQRPEMIAHNTMNLITKGNYETK